MRARYPLWAQIAVTLLLNLAVLSTASGLVLWWQTDRGLSSFLYAPARERVRELGMRIEEEFSDVPPAERASWLADLQKPYRISLVIYDDTGQLIAGPELKLPDQVQGQIVRAPGQRPRRSGRRRGGQPMFLVHQQQPARYWIGYHFPVVVREGRPPVRHTLAVVADSLLTNAFFFDWSPWVSGALAACALTVLCWWPLVRKLSRSIRLVQAASAEIARGKFDVQVPTSGRDELADLGLSVRRMAAQLSRLIHGQRRFLADVAHELCAPLARMQLSTGILAQRAELDRKAPHLKAVERLEQDVSHMSALVGDLLSFTRGSVRVPQLEPLELARIVGGVIQQESAGESVVLNEVSPGTIVLADSEYLKRSIANVIRNAIRYAGKAGPIRVYSSKADSMIRLVVKDQGPGLPEEDLESVFAPFYRLDVSRSPESGGTGLGLAIVKDCVEACGGSVSCRNLRPRGLAVTLLLPQAADHAA